MKAPRCLLAAIVAAIPAAALALDPGTASGDLTVDGQKVPLTHAYALRQDNAEGLMDGAELRLLLADREVAPDLLAGAMLGGLDQLARQDGIRGVLLRMTADRRPETVHGTILYPPRDPQMSLPFFTQTGKGGTFKRFELGDKRVVGEVEGALDTQGAFGGAAAYGYRASFSAPIFEDLPVTADLKGKSARESAPARAFLDFEKILRAGDLEKLRAALTPARWRETQAHLAQIGEAQFKAMTREMVPPTATRERQIERVIVRGDRATVIYRESGAKGFSSLVKDGGGWKVGG